jgi:phosphoribosyl-AMP cyclohydrolase
VTEDYDMKNYVEMFYENSIKKWDYIEHGKGVGSNLYHDKNYKIIKKLREMNRLNELETLLDCDKDSVLLEVASALLYLNNQRAIDVLMRLSEKKGSIYFTAKMNLQNYYSKSDKNNEI